MASGILIVVEGIDGAGKTTQVNLLGRALEDAGETVVLSKEPTDGKWGRIVRESAKTGRLSLEEELQAFIEDRREHIATLVQPALDRGQIVILDRYFYSTIAYQGARGANIEALTAEMHGLAPLPDVVLLIDADPLMTLRRISHNRGDVPNAFEKLEPLQAVRSIFLDLAATEANVKKIDGHQAITDVYHNIITHLLDSALKAKRCFKSYGCDGMYCSARDAGQCRWAELYRALYRRSPRLEDTCPVG